MLQRPSLRLKVQEEYPIIDRGSRLLLGYLNQYSDRDSLVFYSKEIEASRRSDLQEATEFLQDEEHADVESLLQSVRVQRGRVIEFLRERDLRAAVAGTHPDSLSQAQTRVFHWYSDLVGEVSIIPRRLQIYSTTFSVGIEDQDLAISVMNSLRYLMPHVLCLSTSSPMWNGLPTGLKSYRQVLRDSLLRTDLPPYFHGIGEYEDYFKTLIDTNCIKSEADMRWDVRWDSAQKAMVFSLCDAVTRLEDLAALAALLQSLVAWCADLRLRNMQFRVYDRLLIMENKWRAIRYGVEGQLIDFGKELEQTVPRLMWELGALIETQADALGNLPYLERVYRIAEEGSSAERQLRVWRDSDESVEAVVDHIADETEDGC